MIWNAIKLNKELTETKASILIEGAARIKAETDLKEAQDVIGNFMVEKENFEKTIKDLNDKLATDAKASEDAIAALKKEHEDKITAANASVASTVNKELSNIGIEASSIKISQETLPTKSEVLAKLEELGKAHGTTSKEATSYYQKYRAIALGN